MAVVEDVEATAEKVEQKKPETLRIVVVGPGGNLVIESGQAIIMYAPNGQPFLGPPLPFKQIQLHRGEIYELTDPKEIAAVRNTGRIGDDYLELDDKGNVVIQLSKKAHEKAVALLKAGVKGAGRGLKFSGLQDVKEEPVDQPRTTRNSQPPTPSTENMEDVAQRVAQAVVAPLADALLNISAVLGRLTGEAPVVGESALPVQKEPALVQKEPRPKTKGGRRFGK